MKLRCIDNSHLPEGGWLTLERVYEIDPRRDVELNPYGTAAHYYVRGKRYGAWRFVPAEDRDGPQ